MTTVCVAADRDSDVFRRPKTQRDLKMRLAEKGYTRCSAIQTGAAGDLYGLSADWRYPISKLTAYHSSSYSKHTPRELSYDREAFLRASALVAALLKQLSPLPAPYGSDPLPCNDPLPLLSPNQELAEAVVTIDALAPCLIESRKADTSEQAHNVAMDYKVDFADTSGVQTRGKKADKKAAKVAQQAKWFESDNEGDGGADGQGGDEGTGGGGDGSNGAGGGGDDNGGGGDDNVDDWAFGGSKKNKKKTKKKQEDEDEEEEQKAKSEQANNAGSLNWADDANNAAADEDWAQGFTSKKDKKKKGKKGTDDVLPAAPDPPSAFQDISLDDTAPKLEFSFGGNDSKKDTSGFSNWGKTWDFGGVGAAAPTEKDDLKSKKDKKDPDTGFGDNNPWSSFSGTKTKKKTTTATSGFDFGDFGAGTNDLGPDGDLGETKATDDAWGFSTVNKKDKKKGVLEEKKPEEDKVNLDLKEDDTWAGWGTSSAKKDKKKSKKVAEEEPLPPPPPPAAVPDPPEDELSFGFGKKDKKKSKKSAIEEIPETKAEEAFDLGEPESTFDWGFGAKTDKDKKKKKELISEVKDLNPLKEEPKEDEDEWMQSAWGGKKTTTTTKKGKKAAAEDTAASTLLDSIADTKKIDPLEEDLLGGFGATKAKKDKKTKKGIIEEEVPPPPPPEPEPPAVDDVWGAFSKKTTKETTKDKKAKKGKEPSPEPTIVEADPVPEPIDDESWAIGLTPREKKKKEKEMKKQKEDEEAAAAAAKEAEAALKLEEDDLLGAWGAASSKDKKKKEKETKRASIFGAIPEPEPPAKVEEDLNEDMYGDLGLSAKDKKKKKEKEEKKRKEEEEAAAQEAEKAKAAEEDIWGSFGTKTTKKIGKKGKFAEEPPPPAPTPPAQGLTPEPNPIDMLDDLGDDTWAGLTSTKSKASTKKGTLSKTTTKESSKSKDKDVDALGSKSPIEEVPAKAVKSMWGFGGAAAAASKPTTKREKEAKAKKEAEEQAQKEEEERLAREAEQAEAARLEEEKNAKKSKTSKLTKTTTKSSDKNEEKKKKADEDALIDILGGPTPKSTGKLTSKLTKTSSKKEDKAEESKTDDYFGFDWAASPSTNNKKTAGKKEVETKTEINNKGLANKKDAYADLTNDLDFGLDDDKPASSSKTSKNMNTEKSKVGSSSVKDRIKQLESKKEEPGKKSKTDSLLTKDLSPPHDTLSPKEEKSKEKASTSSKLKTATKDLKVVSKKKDAISLAEEKKSKDSVPGSFPGAFGDDDMLTPSSPEKPKTKSKVDTKSVKTKATTTKKSKTDDIDLLMEAPDPPKLPTPPPEDKKSIKKDRPRVERSATSSWGFWGAAPPPKKSSKEKTKDDEESSPPPTEPKERKKDKSPPALSRSKSTRTPREKEREDRREAEKQSKSSESEKDVKSKATERPAKPARGTSFSSFMFGGAPPSAMKTKTPARRSSVAEGSRSSSRQRTGHGAPPSPPPDDDMPMNDKAAKLMGVKSSKLERKSSVKTKSKVPDPYPIDSDDMVMINAPEETPPKESSKSKDKAKSKTSKVKAEIKRSNTFSHDEDVVMVDSGNTGDPLVTSGPDDMAFVDHPPSLKRTNTARKSAGFFGSFFGGRNSQVLEPENERPRSHTLTDTEDHGLPIRTKSSRRKSKQVDTEGFGTDAPAETDADADARRAERRAKRDAKDKAEEADRVDREARRRERRDREKADLEARRSRARDKARKEQEDEDARREERRARRSAKESKRAEETHDETIPDAEKRREERRRLREKLEADGAIDARASKEDRKKKHDDEEDELRRKRDETKLKDRDQDRRKDKKSESSGRKSKASALVEEYHQSRNGSSKGHLNHVPDTGKTNSWIQDQVVDPPDVPPLEGTILDGSNEKPRRVADEAASSKKDKNAIDTDAEGRRERRKSRREKVEKASASGGSEEKREKRSSRRYVNDNVNGDYPIMAFDGRPEVKRTESKRRSFLGGLL